MARPLSRRAQNVNGSGEAMASLRSRSGRSLPHPRIQGKRLSLSHPDLVGLRVHKIDQIIPLDRDDGRGDGEHRTPGGRRMQSTDADTPARHGSAMDSVRDPDEEIFDV